MRSHILIRNFHHVSHASLPPWLFSTVLSPSLGVVVVFLTFSRWPTPLLSSSSVTSLFKIAVTVAPTACRDVIVTWCKELHLPASSLCPNIGHGEKSSDRLETVLACSGDPPDLIGTTSFRICLTSYVDPSWGRRLVCLFPSSSFHKISLLLKVNRSSWYSLH